MSVQQRTKRVAPPESQGNVALAGPNLDVIRSSVQIVGEDLSTKAAFGIRSGQRVAFDLSYSLSRKAPPKAVDSGLVLREALSFWREWSSGCSYRDDHESGCSR